MTNKKTVLFIDDDEEFLYIIKRITKKISYIKETLTAKHGQDALDQFHLWLKQDIPLPNYAFVDINMPIMDGFSFIEKFGELKTVHPKLERVTFIAILSSSINEDDKKRAESYGMFSTFITKPKNINEMKKLLEKLIVHKGFIA